ncbi:MAG: hypothetical protein ACLPKB_30080 [Xanthobacteraceae bacterium]
MTTNRSVGFQRAGGKGGRAQQRRTIAVTELFLTLALAVSTAIAATAISVEIAHAATLEQTVHHVAPTMASGLIVILGRRKAASPEPIPPAYDYGFRARELRSRPGMTARDASVG